MKKGLLIVAIAAIILSLGSCSKGNPTEQTLKILKEATEKVEKAKTPEEANDIAAEVGEEFKKLSEEYPDYKPTPEEQKQLTEATQKFMIASMKKYYPEIPTETLTNKAGSQAVAPNGTDIPAPSDSASE